MKITYISQITIPSRSADSVQVVKACDSLCTAGHEIILKIPYRKKHEKKITDVHQFYRCKTAFPIIYETIWIIPERFRILMIGLKAAFDRSDIVISRSIPAAFICSLFGKKTFLEIHEPLDRTLTLSWLSKRLINFKNFKGLITNCNALKIVTEKGFPKLQGNILALQNGADMANGIKPINLGNEKCIHIGYCGQLYKGKGIEIICELAPQFPNHIFHIVGGLEKDIDYWQKKLHGCKNVVFQGFIEPHEVPDYINAFDIVLAPYQNVVYGFNATNNIAQWTSPMKVFDYMAIGKPIIASDLPFMHEILDHNKNAILCQPDCIQSWCNAIKKLTQDKATSQKISKAAQNKFLDQYTWSKRTEKLMQYINLNAKT